MKTLSIPLIIFMFTINVSSVGARDILPGTIFITGDTVFDDSSIKMDTSNSNIKTDTTLFNVTGAYFVTMNFGIGLMIGNEDSTTSYDSIATTNSSINMIGPMIVYSISLNPDFNIMLGGGLYKVSGDIDDGGGGSFSIDGDGTFITASVVYFLNDSVSLNIGIRAADADIDLTSNYLAEPPVSATMSDHANTIGLSFYF